METIIYAAKKAKEYGCKVLLNPAPAAKLPEANKGYYVCGYESIIKAGENYHMGADDLHWFQAGPEGAVIIEFGTYSNDDKDYYSNYHIAPLEKKEFKILP